MPLKIFVTATYIGMVVVNAMANTLPLNGRQTGEVSDAYANLFAPAGITFSVWGLIYILLAVHVFYQWGLFQKADEPRRALLRKVGMLFAASSLANTAWVFAWHYDVIWLSMVLIIGILVLLGVIVLTLRDAVLTGPEYLMVRLPFSVYLGWITVATVANITVWLVSIGWTGFGFPESTWAVVITAVAAAIGTLAMLRNRDIAYGLVLVWAFFGILIKHISPTGFAGQYPEVITTTIACITVFLASECYIFWRRRAWAA